MFSKITLESIVKLGYAGTLGAGVFGLAYLLTLIIFPNVAIALKIIPIDWILGVGALIGTGLRGIAKAILSRELDPAKLFFENKKAIHGAYQMGIIDKEQERALLQEAFIKYLGSKNKGQFKILPQSKYKTKDK